MARLDPKARAALPNSAFAYVDSAGRRLLPINDESHVRNALSRFNQVAFEDEAAKERAFRRLLAAAAAYGIAPVGFVARRVREAAGAGAPDLPRGPVTFLFSDIEGSTGLISTLGDAYPGMLGEVRSLIASAVDAHGGYEVDSRADEFFAVFAAASQALETAIRVQLEMAARQWADGREVRVRIGLHSGEPALTETGYVGLPVNTGARVCAAGHGGQILMTTATGEVLGELPSGVSLVELGDFELRGLPGPQTLIQVSAPGLETTFPPPRV